MRLILASTSPRRREILSLLGVPFDVVAPDFDETPSPNIPLRDEVVEFAVGKAASVISKYQGALVIGSDTMIELHGKKIGKPADAPEAKEILRDLSGRTHLIFTSVAILDAPDRPVLKEVEEVSVKMRDYSPAEIEEYVRRRESLDKAGAYSIQGHGRALIESIEGDYLAAVGLPLMPIARFLRRRGIAVPVDVEKLYADKSYRNWASF
jgi:septum formation protein